MTDYSKMSDFEINSSVLGFFQPDAEYMSLSADGKSLYHCGLDGNGFHEVVIPDYCNSWADSGPIILGNKICLSCYPKRNDWDAFTLSDKGYAEETTYDANPLRAAMIVFLMMKEPQNDS